MHTFSARLKLVVVSLGAFLLPTLTLAPLSALADSSQVIAPTTAIKHIVIIYQENHSFDNLYGVLCQQLGRCDGSSQGIVQDANGNDIPYTLGKAADKVPSVSHDPTSQNIGVDGGAMDNFDKIGGCSKSEKYACLTQYQPSQFPNLAALASNYTISDRTFEPTASASWGAHLELAASTLQGFTGDNPEGQVSPNGQGWGCDTKLTASWQASPGAPVQQVPSCIPNPDGSGAFETTPVPWTPTIMDRLDDVGLSWKLYTPQVGQRGYGWAICPSFADCIGSNEDKNDVENTQFAKDAKKGTLPAWSVLTPNSGNSQHNGNSMKKGDNWIGSSVKAVMDGPDWSSTAIFITYDDCGCFYDHVPPPQNMGIRVPMAIISPYAKTEYTDSNIASYNSMLAFTEHVFNIPALTDNDATAYDYNDSFDLPTMPASNVQATYKKGQAIRDQSVASDASGSGKKVAAFQHKNISFVTSALTAQESAAVAHTGGDNDDPY